MQRALRPQGQLSGFPREPKCRAHRLALHALAVVLVQFYLSVRSGKKAQRQLRRQPVRTKVFAEGNDRPGRGQHRVFVQRAPQLQKPPAGIALPGGKVEPAPLRQPRGDRGSFQPGVHGPGDSADHQRRAEEVLIGRGVGLRAFGPAVIKGPHQRLPQPESALHGRVQIGQQPVAQAQRILHGQLRLQPVAPRLLAGKGAAAGMKPQDGRKNPQLQPTDGQLVVPNAVHVSANIVAPPRVARVGRHGGKPGLERQRFPAHDGIAGKAHRAALTARPGVPGQDHAPLAAAAVIPIM